MGYLLAFLSVAANTMKGYSGKKTSICAKKATDAPLFSFVRIFICVIIGLAVVLIEGAHTALGIDYTMLAICAFSGVTNAIFLITWMLAVQKNPMVFVDVSLTLGSIIPAVLCLIFFGEAIVPLKLLGFALILFAAITLSMGRKSDKKVTFIGIALVAISSLGSGLTNFSQKLYDNYVAAGASCPKSVFLFYGYIFSALALLVFLAIIVLRQAKNGGEEAKSAKSILYPLVRPLPHIIIMSACLFIDNYCKTAAIAHIPSQVLYPIIQGSCIVTTNFVAAIFFGEKPTKFTFIGTAITIAGIALMSLA